MIPRREVMAALRAALGAVPNIRTTGVRLRHHSEVADQPALYAVHVDERFAEEPYNLRGIREITAEVWLYTKGKERSDGDLEAAVDDLIDGVETALAPDPVTGANTLGDMVTACWIERVQISPGHAEGQAAAVVDVTILTLPT